MGSILRPYYYGSKKWDNYLLDIQDSLNTSNNAQHRSLRVQTDALAQFEDQTRILQADMLARQEDAEQMMAGLNQLQETLHWGFGLITDRMDRQVELFSQVVNHLNQIHQTLKTPSMTQAREFYDQGIDHFRKELYEEAMESFLQSEMKNKVNPILQLRIGLLYLEGRTHHANVINIPLAEQHLLLAARYADADRNVLPHWNAVCGRAYYHAGQAAYLAGESEQKTDDSTAMRACLNRALEHLASAFRVWPEFSDTLYCQAKCYALQGRNQEALERFKLLSDRDRTYYARSLQDHDFDAIRNEIEEIFTQALRSPGPLACECDSWLRRCQEALNWAKGSGPEDRADQSKILSIGQYLDSASRALNTLEVNLQRLFPRLRGQCVQLEEISARVMQQKILQMERGIAEATAQKQSLEGAVNYHKQQMNQTKGSTGMGCLFMFIFYLVFQFGIPVLLSPWRSQLEQFRGPEAILSALVLFMIWVTTGFFVGKYISKKNKNSPFAWELQKAMRSLTEWHSNTLPWIQQVETQAQALRGELGKFLQWSAKKPRSLTTGA